jgi:imidazolonepropionase
VDSHTHLIFAGDRSAEFESRMKGTPYAAGGINSTVLATRDASDDELRALVQSRIDEMHNQGTGTVEIKTGYGLTVDQEQRLARIASEFTEDVTFLGGHVIPPEYADDPDAYVDLVCGPMLDAVAPYAKWIDVFCEEGAFTVAQSRRILESGMLAGLRPRIHAAQLGPSDSVRMALSLGATSIDHGTFLTHCRIPPRSSRSCPVRNSRRSNPFPTHGHLSTTECKSPSRRTATPAPRTPRRCRSVSLWPCGKWE